MELYVVKQSTIPGMSSLIPGFADEQLVTTMLLYHPIKPGPNNHATAADDPGIMSFRKLRKLVS